MHALGVNDVFGIPGDFVLGFYGMLEHSPIRIVGTCSEHNAGFAADAYARINGIGAVCVTYCVGGLSLLNAIAGAYAEKSPVIVISGAPGIEERADNPLLHHRVGAFSTQREVFEQITVAATCLDDPLTAFREIDRCLGAAMRTSGRSISSCRATESRTVPRYQRRRADRGRCKATKPRSTKRSAEAGELLEPRAPAGDPRGRRDPPLRPPQAGARVRRAAPDSDLLDAAAKSVVSEMHPLYLGVYEGAMGRADMRRYVEESDCVILLGAFMTDINLGIYTAKLDPNRCIYATSEDAADPPPSFSRRAAPGLRERLAEGEDQRAGARAAADGARRDRAKYVAQDRAKITISGLFQRVNELLDEHTVVVADVGDSLFGATDLVIHRDSEFLSPAYYTSMGFAMPAAIGVQVANRERRPLVLVGDGAFQMTGMELSTAVRRSSTRS